MDKMLLSFKNSYMLVPIAIVLTVVLVFIDSLISNKSVTKKEYIKTSLLVGSIVTAVLYISNLKGRIEEEIMSGPAPF